MSNKNLKKTSKQIREAIPADKNVIDDMRFQLTKILDQTKQIKSKTRQMEGAIQKREAAIKSVYGQTKSSQKLKTANANTIKLLKSNIQTLQNIKRSQENTLKDLLKSDRYWQNAELRSEIVSLYDENERLQIIDEGINHDFNEAKKNITIARESLSRSDLLNREIQDMNEDIKVYLDKIQTYSHSDLKSRKNATLYNLSQNPDKITSTKKELQKEYEELIEKMNEDIQETKDSEETEYNTVKELNQIIHSAIDRIHNALSGNVEEEEEEDNDSKYNDDDNKSDDDNNQSNDENEKKSEYESQDEDKNDISNSFNIKGKINQVIKDISNEEETD